MARKVIYKQNGLAGQPDAPTGYKYVGFNGDTFSEKTGATVSALGGGSKPYTEMVGLFSQSGTNAPTVSILENDIPGTTLSGSYLGPGIYRVSFGDNTIFDDASKVFIQLETRSTNGLYTIGAANSFGITINGKDYTGAFSNIGSTNATFVVRIYS